MAINLYDHQLDALDRIKNGSILCGGTGSGKSLTAVAYYYLQNGGHKNSLVGCDYKEMPNPPKDLYIITTARKRDTCEWLGELSPFLLSTDPDSNLYSNKVVIDSWNNIKKYAKVTGAFFIFDEQRVVGSGAWVKAFLNIARKNKWILLSATPGDTWSDYIPVFVANGFYKNKTEFTNEHVVYSRFSKFPKIDRYIGTKKLERLRNEILITMDFKRHTEQHHETIICTYDMEAYRRIMRDRWNIWERRPILNASELCRSLQKVVNSDVSRQNAVLDILKKHPRAIIFYNYDYELEILRNISYTKDVVVREWNGHKHEPIPQSKRWVYLVQYNAGSEGWNCITSDTTIFFSQNYSYKVMTQASGRIDRLNTPYIDLYYYHLKSRSSIDLAIGRALSNKKKFNESGWSEKNYTKKPIKGEKANE